MLNEAECADCAGTGEICSACCAPCDWCDCEQGDLAPHVFTCKSCRDDDAELELVAAA